MWGIIPAAGSGSRIRPLGFSKELLPVGSRYDGATERPRAVSEYLVERMETGGANKICFVVGPGKSDIMEYFGSKSEAASFFYAVQSNPEGLCDAIFRALPLIGPTEPVCVGLPDTIWFPEDGFCRLDDDRFSFLLFPVDHPEFFDAVIADPEGRVREIQVKREDAGSHWVWGAFKLPGNVLGELFELWKDRGKQDEYLGTLVNEYLRLGGSAWAVPAGQHYVDVGTFNGYREAIRLLQRQMEVGVGR
ncbi:MAG: nucleotidyltransferase family protein [Bryobacterales bacterium]|nr:nucleotidyltransferase family protein [Bryobacterales bacterium]